MEQLWLREGASGGKRSGRQRPENGLTWRQTVATGCQRLPFGSHVKQGICDPLPAAAEVPSLRRRGSTRGPLSAGFRRALTQATHYSSIMHDLLFTRASTKQSIADSASRSAPATLASPRLMNGARRPGEKTLAQPSLHAV
jgi:hypothetical protein